VIGRSSFQISISVFANSLAEEKEKQNVNQFFTSRPYKTTGRKGIYNKKK
jgi:hypothetical protein